MKLIFVEMKMYTCFFNMEKIKYRAVIEFLFLEGVEPKQIHERLLKVYKDSSPSLATVYNWVAEFKRGRASLADDPRQGVKTLNIYIGTVSHILSEALGFKKLCAQWMPHSLTMEQKHIRMRMAKINELKYELLEHSPYSPDLAPSDFWLFSHLKKCVRGKRFSYNDEVIAAVDEYFADLPEKHYRDGMVFII